MTGRANEKDGADRVVNGNTMIQTKYCRTTRETVNSAFDQNTGTYRYKNQVLEVPKDQYARAVELMKQKIKEGKVPGVTNPDDAQKLVKQGSITYQQALNIAKAGNLDSLWYDVKTQSVTAAYAFGISFIVQYANCRWNGMEDDDSLKLSITAGMRTGSIALGAGLGTKKLLDRVTEDDVVKMLALVQDATAELAFDYMVKEDELTEQIAPRISEYITPKWLMSMYQAGRRQVHKEDARFNFAYQELETFFAEVAQAREKVFLPSERVVKREISSTYWQLFVQYLKARIARLFGSEQQSLPG